MTDNQDLSVPSAWRAWVWKGGESPADLQDCTISALPLNPDDVLVRNAAIGLNPVDWKVLPMQVDRVPGVDGAGVVVGTGENVDRAWIGSRVAYHQHLLRNGSFAEFTVLKARALMRIPQAVDFATAAAFPCPGLTAWQALEKIPRQPGASLLIAGAGGSVGHFLVQLAQARGFEVSTMSSERHWLRMNVLGVSHCLGNTVPDPTIRQPRYYAAIDVVGPEHATQLAECLKANGHLVCIQGRVEQWPVPEFSQALSMHEVALGALHQYGDDEQWHILTQQGESMMGQMELENLHSQNLLTFSYDQLPAQLQALKNRNFSGKQVILL